MRKLSACLVVGVIVGGAGLGRSQGQPPDAPPVIEAPLLPPIGGDTSPLPPVIEPPKPEAKPKIEVPTPELPRVEVPMPAPVPAPVPTPIQVEAKPVSRTSIPETGRLAEFPKFDPSVSEDAKKILAVGASTKAVPSVSVEAVAPESVGIGQNLNYDIVVRNVGNVYVQQIRIDDELPPGTKYLGSDPAAEVLGDRLQWALGGLEVNGEKRVRVQVKPNAESEFHTKPTVTFSTLAAMQVRIVRPKLQLEVLAAETVSVGDEVVFDIKLTNVGSGAAQKMLLEAEPTRGLTHPQLQGNVTKIQAEVAGLKPGESRNIKLRTQAVASGAHTCVITASTFGADRMASTVALQVHEAKLTLKMTQPPRCLVRAEPVFQLELVSHGTTATPPVQMAAALPDGLEFISAADNGVYDPVTKTINWTLPAQAVGAKKTIAVRTRANAAGNLAMRAVAQAGPKIDTRAEGIIAVEGVPALLFEVSDLVDPVEVGKETCYEIKLANQGTAVCTNVRVSAALTDGLTITGVTAPVPYKVQGQSLVFDPIPRLALKGEQVIRVRVRGGKPGDQRFKAQLSCDQLKQPVVKEESTSFYQQ